MRLRVFEGSVQFDDRVDFPQEYKLPDSNFNVNVFTGTNGVADVQLKATACNFIMGTLQL